MSPRSRVWPVGSGGHSAPLLTPSVPASPHAQQPRSGAPGPGSAGFGLCQRARHAESLAKTVEEYRATTQVTALTASLLPPMPPFQPAYQVSSSTARQLCLSPFPLLFCLSPLPTLSSSSFCLSVSLWLTKALSLPWGQVYVSLGSLTLCSPQPSMSQSVTICASLFQGSHPACLPVLFPTVALALQRPKCVTPLLPRSLGTASLGKWRGCEEGPGWGEVQCPPCSPLLQELRLEISHLEEQLSQAQEVPDE